jgi:chromosomal replication initiation ATPase DnaA
MANILYSKAFYGWTQKRIGLYLGGRDHSTIIHGLQNFQDFYETDKSFRRKAELATLIATKIIKNESIAD